MTAAGLISLGLNLSTALMVFAVTLGAGASLPRQVLRSPGLIARSLFAMYVVMPTIAIVVAHELELARSLKVALVLLALSPVPPVLPGKQLKAGGSQGFVLGLLVVSAAAAVVVVPAGIALIRAVFGLEVPIPHRVTLPIVGISVLLPVLAGLLGARFAPRLAARAAGPASIVAGLLLVATLLPLLWAARSGLAAQFGGFTVLAMALFALAGLAVGHLLGGPDPDNRSALALATATRHPGVALAVLHVVAPGEQSATLTILMYLIVASIVAVPYVAWRKRLRTAASKG